MTEPLIDRRVTILVCGGAQKIPAVIENVEVVYTLRDDQGNKWTARRGDFEVDQPAADSEEGR